MNADKKRKGFTLAELLIVVAIIAVLVAVSIPIFSSQLKKSKLAVDQANVRSAKAAAAAEYMGDGESGSVSYLYDGGKVVKIDSANLQNISSITSGSGYGKSDADDNKNNETGASGTPKDGYVEVIVNGDSSDQITASWTGGAAVFDSYSGELTLTGSLVSNEDVLSEIKSLKLNEANITSIKAAQGSTIRSDTENVFSGFTNLKSIDLSGAVLVHSSPYMFSEMPDSVQTITLPQCSDPYNIAGVWYYADGTSVISKWDKDNLNGSGTRITAGHNGSVVYRTPPNGVQGKRISR